MHKLTTIILSAAVCAAAGFAQLAEAQSSSSAAFLYVTYQVPNSTEFMAWEVASDGSFTPVSASPFAAGGVTYLAANGKFLFGSNNTGSPSISSFSIEPDGALTYSYPNALTQTGDPNGSCATPGSLFFDHTGQTLYNSDLNCENATDDAFSVNEQFGQLTWLDSAGDSPELGGLLHFIGNNVYAYGASCYHFNPRIYGVKRAGNGSIALLDMNPAIPANGKDPYCPWLAIADTTNHLAVSLWESNDQSARWRLATYTANSAGNLTTTSTNQTMPFVNVGAVNDMNMSPSGDLLAVAGEGGLEVFHFNGANPITPYAVLTGNIEFDQVFWDHQNHLYALSRPRGAIFVFTVTPTTHSQAPGSPHKIANPYNMVVQPLPLP